MNIKLDLLFSPLEHTMALHRFCCSSLRGFLDEQACRYGEVMHIALVTARHIDPSSTDDVHLETALAERGVAVQWHSWDAPKVPWQAYDLVVLRSCWDYHQRVDEFSRWLDDHQENGARLANSYPLVTRNLHKRYLAEIASRGVAVPPLRLLARGSRATMQHLAAELGEDLVLKPAISATAWRTARTRMLGNPQKHLDDLLATGDVIVQQFVPEIADGEWSLIFFQGRYSHAVLKRPARGDFRSQREFGGEIAAGVPPAGSIDLAHEALAQFEPSVYARIDVVVGRAGPLVMEVELIEPQLYFGLAPAAADRAADALIATAHALSDARSESRRRKPSGGAR